MDTGYKLLREDGSSIHDMDRVTYPLGEWIDVPDNGAYIAVDGGLYTGGNAPLLAQFECADPTGAPAPHGVVCYRRVRRVLIDLIDTALHGRHADVRLAAVVRINDQSVLAEIARSDVDYYIRRAAIRRVNDQSALAEISRSDVNWCVRHAAVKRVDDLR